MNNAVDQVTGRKSKKTPERVKAILQAISDGLPYKSACAVAGIHYDTFNEWRKADPEFSEQVAHAETAIIRNALECIRAASVKDWKAAAWLLERRCPQFLKPLPPPAPDSEPEFNPNYDPDAPIPTLQETMDNLSQMIRGG